MIHIKSTCTFSAFSHVFIHFYKQVAIVDRELVMLSHEREEKSRRLNLKRMQHVSTLQQLSKSLSV